MSTQRVATGLGWPTDSDDVSRETSEGQPTGLGWPSDEPRMDQNVSRETQPEASA